MQIIRTYIAGAAALALAAFAPLSGASAHDVHLHFNDHEDLLEQLIELDADGIEDLRDDFADAREDIADAIIDVEEAKEEVKEVPLGDMIATIAFKTASATVSKATTIALNEVRDELDKAEAELDNRREALGEAEFAETSEAISVVREELDGLQDALGELTAALKEA